MKTAILVASMGGADSLQAVRPFLFNLFNDPAIIRIPFPFRSLLAAMISWKRTSHAQAIYQQIGGKSPLLENTRVQAAALEKELVQHGAYRCFVGMSYSPPVIDEAIRQIQEYKPDKIIVLPLYPQFSTTTTASVWRSAQQAIRKYNVKCPVRLVDTFYEHSGFIASFASHLLASADRAKRISAPMHVLFSAHGLPEKIVEAGDTYPTQCLETARALAKATGLTEKEWSLCYQSRVGRMKWLDPYTDEEIIKRSRGGEAIIVVPISFVSEHSETMVELGIEYRALAKKHGAAYYEVVPTVADSPQFIQGLAEIILKN